MTRLALWCAAALLAALLPVTPAAAAVTCAKPGTTYAQKPWAEQLLGTERVAPVRARRRRHRRRARHRRRPPAPAARRPRRRRL
ncbi:hypothetical protein ACFQX7_11375 [Luedemannella flava]